MVLRDDPERVYQTVLNAEESIALIVDALNAALGEGVGNAIYEMVDRRIEKQMALHVGDTSLFGDRDERTWEFVDPENAEKSQAFIDRMTADAPPRQKGQ